MLAPAYGILKMVLEAYQQKVCDDIALIPVSICYDEVPEQGSYTKELGGEQKVKESAKALIRSRKVIRRNFGKVYVRFAPALYARDIFQPASEAELDPMLKLQKTAFQLCKTINDFTPITPKSLVSSILLAHRYSALSLEDILRLSEMLAEYVKWSGLALSVPLDESFKRAIEQTVRRLQKTGVASVSDAVPRSYYCENRKRVLLNFYKNNALHCLVTPSITLLSFFLAARSGGDWLQGALALRNILKFEFFFNPTPLFVSEVKANLKYFLGGDPAGTAADSLPALGAHFADWNDVSIFLRLTGDLLESYLTALQYVRETSDRQVEKKAFVQKIVKHAEAKSAQGGISFPESLSVQNYSNALLLFENLKLLTFEKEQERTLVQVQPWDDKAEGLAVQIRSFLDLMAENPEALVTAQNPRLRK